MTVSIVEMQCGRLVLCAQRMAVVALLSYPATAAAQFAGGIGVGSTIRYSTSAAPTLHSQGTVTRRTTDTLFVSTRGSAFNR